MEQQLRRGDVDSHLKYTGTTPHIVYAATANAAPWRIARHSSMISGASASAR